MLVLSIASAVSQLPALSLEIIGDYFLANFVNVRIWSLVPSVDGFSEITL